MTFVPGVIVKTWVTGCGCAAGGPPACAAVIEHTPPETNVTLAVVVFAVQTLGVFDVYATGNPVDEIALSPGGGLVKGELGGSWKLIVFAPAPTLNDRVTGTAAAYVEVAA